MAHTRRISPLVGLFLLALAACGGGSPTPSAAVAPFMGVWGATLMTTITCGSNLPNSANQQVAFQLNTRTGSDVTYTADSGCQFIFQVSGTTATLSNGPVSCTTSPGGVATTLKVDSYTLSTTDGHTLTVAVGGTVSQSGTTCTYASNGTGTR